MVLLEDHELRRLMVLLEAVKPHHHMTFRYVVATPPLCKDLTVAWEHAFP